MIHQTQRITAIPLRLKAPSTAVVAQALRDAPVKKRRQAIFSIKHDIIETSKDVCLMFGNTYLKTTFYHPQKGPRNSSFIRKLPTSNLNPRPEIAADTLCFRNSRIRKVLTLFGSIAPRVCLKGTSPLEDYAEVLKSKSCDSNGLRRG